MGKILAKVYSYVCRIWQKHDASWISFWQKQTALCAKSGRCMMRHVHEYE